MRYLPDFVRNEIMDGVTGFDLDWSNVSGIDIPRLSPKLMIFDWKQAKGKSRRKLEASYGGPFAEKGVYILFDSQPTDGGKYNVRVGLSGVDGNKKLFERLKEHVSTLPNNMKKWDKAVAIFDWEDDIPIEIIAETRSKEKKAKIENRDLIDARMGVEAKFLEKKLNEVLKEISTLIPRSKDSRKGFIVNPDIQRYNLYILYILELLNREINFTKRSATNLFRKNSTGNMNLMKMGKLAVGENLCGKFDSKATIVNIDGSISVKKYRKGENLVETKDDLRLKVISSNCAKNIILEENSKVPTMSSMEFWSVERNGYQIKLSSL